MRKILFALSIPFLLAATCKSASKSQENPSLTQGSSDAKDVKIEKDSAVQGKIAPRASDDAASPDKRIESMLAAIQEDLIGLSQRGEIQEIPRVNVVRYKDPRKGNLDGIVFYYVLSNDEYPRGYVVIPRIWSRDFDYIIGEKGWNYVESIDSLSAVNTQDGSEVVMRRNTPPNAYFTSTFKIAEAAIIAFGRKGNLEGWVQASDVLLVLSDIMNH